MAVADRQLSNNFWLHEFPGWDHPLTNERDVARLRESVQRVLQPIRNEFGPVVPTSWMRWSDGSARDGSHAHGGTVDFQTPSASLRDVASWGVTYLLPSGYVGRWIYEPARAATDPGGRQGEHIHMAPRAAMLEALGIGDIGAYNETSEGRYEPMAGAFWDPPTGAYGDPFPLDPINVVVSHNLLRWAILGAVAGATIAPERRD